MKRLIPILLFLAVVSPAATVFRVDPTPVMTIQGNVPAGGFPVLHAIPGAQIALCSDAACSIPVISYADYTGATACPINAPVTLPGSSQCSQFAGTQAQFGFWLTGPANYYYTVTTPQGVRYGPFPISVGVVSTGATTAVPAISTSQNFTPILGGGAISAGTNAILLPTCPAGITPGSSGNAWLYLSAGVGTAEPVPVTSVGFSGTSCTVTVINANSHSGAWVVGPASCGIQETVMLQGAGGSTLIPPGSCQVHAPIFLPSVGSTSLTPVLTGYLQTHLAGSGRFVTILNVAADFPLTGAGVITSATTAQIEPGLFVNSLSIRGPIPDSTNLANYTHWPPFINLQNSPRSEVHDVTLFGCWTGIAATSSNNATIAGGGSGSVFDNVWTTCFNSAINADNSWDTLKIHNWHTANQPLTPNQIIAYFNPANYCGQFGRNDSLEGTNWFGECGGGFRFYAQAVTTIPTSATLSNITTDTASQLRVEAGQIYVSSYAGSIDSGQYATIPNVVVTGGALSLNGGWVFNTNPTLNSISHTGGVLDLSGFTLYSTNDAVAVKVSGTSARALINGSYFTRTSANTGAGQEVLITDGQLVANGNQFDRIGSTAYSNPFMDCETTASTRCTITNNRSTGTGGGSGVFVKVQTDDFNLVWGNVAPGYAYNFPVNPLIGTYQGSQVYSVNAAASPVTVRRTDGTSATYLCNATAGAVALNLPFAAASIGSGVTVVKTDSSANACSVVPAGGDNVNGTGVKALKVQYQTITLTNDGSHSWYTESTTWTGQVNVMTFGAKGDGTTDDSAAVTSAIAAACAAPGGTVYFPPGTYNISVVSTCSNITLKGEPGASIIKPVYASGTHNAITIQGSGSGSTVVTSDVNGAFAGRALNTANSIVVASNAGISAGTWLLLEYGESSTRTFGQLAQVSGVSGTTINFNQAIGIPMSAAQSSPVNIISSPVSYVRVQDLVFDGTGLTGTALGTGLLRTYCIYCSTDNLTFRNFTGGHTPSDVAAFWSFVGYGNRDTNLRGVNAGSHNGDFQWTFETKTQVSNGSSDNNGTDAHGPDFAASTWMQVSNFHIQGASGRCMRLIGVANSQFDQIVANSCGENGIFITWNSYNLQLQHLMLNLDTLESGIRIGDDDESYIDIDGVKGHGNYGAAYSFILTNGTAHNINIRNVDPWTVAGTVTNGISINTANSNLSFANGNQYSAHLGCTGTATASVTLVMSVVPPGACTNTGTTVLTEIVVPSISAVRNLNVKAVTGGVNGSSGVVSIVKVGVGVILSCTVGTGTSCSNTTGAVQVNAGDVLLVQFTTQGGETLAGVVVDFEY